MLKFVTISSKSLSFDWENTLIYLIYIFNKPLSKLKGANLCPCLTMPKVKQEGVFLKDEEGQNCPSTIENGPRLYAPFACGPKYALAINKLDHLYP